MTETFKITGLRGPVVITWRSDGFDVEADERTVGVIRMMLRPGAASDYDPVLGGGFDGYDPANLRHVRKGIEALVRRGELVSIDDGPTGIPDGANTAFLTADGGDDKDENFLDAARPTAFATRLFVDDEDD